MWDSTKAIGHLNAKAHAASTYRCAKYVREAIEAGGITLQNAPEARLYGQSLKSAGFVEVSPPGTPFRAGDVVVIQETSTVKEGHMAMFNGSIWVSDYRQNAAIFPSGSFERERPAYKLLRHPQAATGSPNVASAVSNAGINGRLVRVGQTYQSVATLTRSRFQALKYIRECRNISGEISSGADFIVKSIEIAPQQHITLDGKIGNAGTLLKLSHSEFGKMFQAQTAALGVQKTPPANLRISDKGMKFLSNWESQAGVSNKLHWPGGASGVTLGAGYDMKIRDKAEIKKDMVAIGLDAKAAEKIAEGSTLTMMQAKNFCTTNKSLVSLSKEAEAGLLKHSLPQYEKQVRNAVTVSLYQHEYDALVTFCYNIPSGATSVAKLLNAGNVDAALKEWKLYVNSGGSKMQGLVNRRTNEIALFSEAKY